MNTGERIKQRRIELGMSQEDLAKKLGYSHKSSINKIELGYQNLTQSKIAMIAEALETTPSYIMGWDEEEKLSFEDDNYKRFTDIISTMSEEEQNQLYDYMMYITSKR